MPVRSPMLGAGLVALLAGCTGGSTATAAPPPAVTVTQLPLSAAGGPCELLGYPTIEQHLRVRFDVAVATRVDDATTCVVQSRSAAHPDLVLSVTDSTAADAEIFASELLPAGAKPVNGLGRAAYQLTVAPGGGHAAAEVGWLATDTRVMTLRYTLANGQDAAQAGAQLPGLVELARAVDRSGS